MPPPAVVQNNGASAVSTTPATFTLQNILKTESSFLGRGANAVDKTRRLAFADEKGEQLAEVSE